MEKRIKECIYSATVLVVACIITIKETNKLICLGMYIIAFSALIILYYKVFKEKIK